MCPRPARDARAPPCPLANVRELPKESTPLSSGTSAVPFAPKGDPSLSASDRSEHADPGIIKQSKASLYSGEPICRTPVDWAALCVPMLRWHILCAPLWF